MKKLISLVIVFALLFSLSLPAAATTGTRQADAYYRGISIILNGKEIAPCDVNGKNTEPFIIEGTTYLPVRAIAEALGLDVDWDNATSTVTLSSGGEVINRGAVPTYTKEIRRVTIGYRDIKIMLDGEELIPTDVNGKYVEPFIMNNSTYLPVRAIAEALGLRVEWDEKTNTISLYLGYGAWATDYVDVTITEDATGYSLDGFIDYKFDRGGRMTDLVMSINELAYMELICGYYEDFDLLGSYRVTTDNESFAHGWDYAPGAVLLSEADYIGDKEVGRTNYTYDELGRISESVFIADGVETVTEYEYDSLDRPFREYYEDGSYLEYTYDDYDRLVSEKLYYGGRVLRQCLYVYDDAWNLLSMDYSEQDLSICIDWTYDVFGNILSEQYRETSPTGEYSYSDVYTYNENGEVLTRNFTDSDGVWQITENTYDANGLLSVAIIKDDSGSVTQTYSYGKYDLPSRVVSSYDGITMTMDFSYTRIPNRPMEEILLQLIEQYSIF